MREVNQKEVARDEILSDRVYEFDREKRQLRQIPESIEKEKGDGAMRKRNVAILFRLNRKEAEILDKKVKKSGLSREAYLRHLISGVVPRDAPAAGLLFYDEGTPPDRE